MSNERILYVDDNRQDLKLLSTILKRAGYEVFCATDTKESMETFMRERLDLVLLDFNLGQTDGGILAFEMRRRKPEVRIAYLCGETSRQMPVSLVEGVIEKCVDREKLVAEVRRILSTPLNSAA